MRSEGALYGPEAIVSPAFPRVGFCCLLPSIERFWERTVGAKPALPPTGGSGAEAPEPCESLRGGFSAGTAIGLGLRSAPGGRRRLRALPSAGFLVR